MQSVSSRNWTRITVSISYDDNHYTTGTSTQKLDDRLFLDVETNFCRTAHQLKWLSKIQEESNTTTTTTNTNTFPIYTLDHPIHPFFFIIQRVKARAISCPHQPATLGDNTVSEAQGGTATPGTTKQLLPPDRVLRELYILEYRALSLCSSWYTRVDIIQQRSHRHIYIYIRQIKSRDYIGR